MMIVSQIWYIAWKRGTHFELNPFKTTSMENQGFWLQPSKNLRKIMVLRLWEPLGDPKGVLAGPGTPTDPKLHKFVTKRVAIPPFWTFGPASCTEFRAGAFGTPPGLQNRQKTHKNKKSRD